MSYCLTLAVIKNEHSSMPVAYDRLRTDLEGDEIFEPIRAESTPLDMPILWHNDEGLETYSTDAYDNPLTFITAYRLAAVWPTVNVSRWDAAVREFMKALPPSTRIVLYWC